MRLQILQTLMAIDTLLKDVLTRLPTQKASALAELPPHNWEPAGKV
ncbi:hypothetical protein A3L25_019785 [Pseudomonas putida]|uniref:Transposase n=1 Tax=Pseudomonas putida TaxID=303 RepID=A0AAP9MTL7_PSEPU|nr:hypothetical protein [Pseudomonas putida]QJQ07867.1 hypothetical protein A3L25_019785 [Pseudomonas putida]